MIEVLLRMLGAGSLPHALLFVGPPGSGKTTVAHALARTRLNHARDLALHPDFLSVGVLVDEKIGKRRTQIHVDQVREMNSRLGMSSLTGGAKVVFVEEAAVLSLGAVNALLKTLEEPKGNTHFILRAGSRDELPATIVSRCQTFRFGIVPSTEILDGLCKLGFSRDDAQAAAAQSLGRPGRAIRFLKEGAYQAELTTGINQAVTFLESSLPERLGQVMELIPKTETEKGETLVSILDQWEHVCRDVLLRQLCLPSLQTCPSDGLDRLAASISQKDLMEFMSRLAEVRACSSHHVNSHLALEHLALATP